MWTPNPINLEKKEKNNISLTNHLTINIENFIQQSDNTWTSQSQAIIKENLDMLQNKIFEILSEKKRLEKYNIMLNSIIHLINGIGIALNINSCFIISNIALFSIQFLLFTLTLYSKFQLKITLYTEVCENLKNLHRSIETEMLKDKEYRIEPNTLFLTMESHYKKIIKKLEVLNM